MTNPAPQPHTDLDEALLASLEAELDAQLAWADTDPFDPADNDKPEPEPWHVKNAQEADWASLKLQAAARRIEQAKAWATAEKARIDAVLAQQTRADARTSEFMEDRLAAYTRGLIADGMRGKSLALRGGVLKLTSRGPAITVTDEEAFLKWALVSAPELVRTKHEPAKADLNKAAKLVEGGNAITADGEPIPGVKWEPQADSVSFKAAP